MINSLSMSSQFDRKEMKRGARRFVCLDVKGRRARSKNRAINRKKNTYIKKYEDEKMYENKKCSICSFTITKGVCDCLDKVVYECDYCKRVVNTFTWDYTSKASVVYACCGYTCMTKK